MYLLDVLRERTDRQDAPTEKSEFRLLCSGALYNGRVFAGDWTMSDACRILLRTPVNLLVVSIPIDYYPQEIMLRMEVGEAREERTLQNGSTFLRVFYPHEEVATDFAALLTVLLRRLVTVYVHVNVIPPAGSLATLGLTLDSWPMPVSRPMSGGTWRPRPPVFLTSNVDGMTRVEGYSVPPLGVDTEWLMRILTALPLMPNASAVIGCARLYAQAMQLIEERPELAYQLFIAAAETLASIAEVDHEPSPDEKVEVKHEVRDRAIQLGVSPNDARELAILATKGMNWTSRRFREFLKRYTDESIWAADNVFIVPQSLVPDPSKFDVVLKNIYRTRGANLHSGRSFPVSAGIGTSSRIPVSAFGEALSGEGLPPVAWFERVVQKAVTTYIEQTLNVPKARPAF
jgi:hypothetical protein